MKAIRPFSNHTVGSRGVSLLACVAFTATGFAAPSAPVADVIRTAPVGLATLRVPGKSARALSFPLANPAVFTGTVSAFSGTTISVAAAAWTPGSWGPFESNPYVVRLLTGDSAGQIFAIASSSADSLVLAEEANEQISMGQQFEVVPVDTLADIFGAKGAGLLTSSDPVKADNILIHGGDSWSTYYNDGTRWLKQGDATTVQNSVAILPDEGIFLVRKASTPLAISVAGEIPAIQTATELPADAITFLANPFPLNTRLGDLQLQDDPSWISAPNDGSADRVWIYGGKDWVVYFYDGKQWRQQGGAVKNPLVTKGSAIVIERKSGRDILHSPEPPYSLN